MYKRDRRFKDIKKASLILLWSCPQEFVYFGALQWHKLRVAFNWSLPASWHFGRYSISSTSLLYIIYTASAGGVTLWEASAWKYLACYIQSILCHPCLPVPSTRQSVCSPLLNFSVPVQSWWCSAHCAQCLHGSAFRVRRSWGLPWVPFPAFSRGRMLSTGHGCA